MRSVLDLVENRFELAALVVFLSVGAVAITGTLELEMVAGLISIVGFAVLLPLVLIFGDRIIEQVDDEAHVYASDPVEALRERYARGEISHEEFERRVERLVETEDLDASNARAAANARDAEVEVE